MNNLDKQKQKVDELLSDIKKMEDEFFNNPNISEESKNEWIEYKKKLEEESKIEEEEYQKWLEANKHKKIIGYNPENFKPIFEDEQPR